MGGLVWLVFVLLCHVMMSNGETYTCVLARILCLCKARKVSLLVVTTQTCVLSHFQCFGLGLSVVRVSCRPLAFLSLATPCSTGLGLPGNGGNVWRVAMEKYEKIKVVGRGAFG